MKKLLITSILVLFTIITIVAQTFIIEDVKDLSNFKWQGIKGEIVFNSLGIKLTLDGKTLYFVIQSVDNSGLAPIAYAKSKGIWAKFTVVRDKDRMNIIWEFVGEMSVLKCREKK